MLGCTPRAGWCVLFILVGLQLHAILTDLSSTSPLTLLFYGVIVSAIVMLARIAWVFSATYAPLVARRGDVQQLVIDGPDAESVHAAGPGRHRAPPVAGRGRHLLDALSVDHDRRALPVSGFLADWVATGAASAKRARTSCGTGVTGAPVWFVQYLRSGFDTDYAC